MSPDLKRFKYIDSLRGIAILMVILCHSHPYFAEIYNVDLPPFFNSFVQNGDKGVTLFFLISAFTLCLSLSSKQFTEQKPIRNYFIRRFFRIVPLYYFVILLILLIDINSPSGNSIIANILFIHGMSPYWVNSTVPGGWSVGIEMLFYLIFPLIFSRISSLSSMLNLSLLTLVLSKVVLSLLTKYPLSSDGILWKVFVYENFISQLPVFMIGLCLFQVYQHKETFNKDSELYRSYLYIAFLIFLDLLGGNIFKSHYFFAIAFAFAAYGLSKIEPWILVNAFTVWVGKLSYSIYLLHLVIAKLLVKFHWNYYSSDPLLDVLIRFTIVFSLSAILALLTYRLIERPFQAIGKRLIDRLEKKRKRVVPQYILETSEIN